MIFWMIFLPLFFSSSFIDISFLSDKAHELCLERLSFKGPLEDIYKALLCGKELSYSPIRRTFIKGGLIHLTVLSGAHLVFLERLWKKIPLPVFFKTHGLFVVLILYALTGGLRPPIVRALFSFFIFQTARTFKLFWSPLVITLLSGLLCIIYQPAWINSLSLQLSLLACLLYNGFSGSLKRAFFIYLFILPVINRWESLSPFTVLINWIFAPLVSFFLFPLSFFAPFMPFLYSISDPLWQAALWLLQIADVFPPAPDFMRKAVPQKWIWFYMSFVCAALFVFSQRDRKRRLYKKASEG